MKLQILAAGTGRDGTVSLAHFLNQLFEQEGKGRTAGHEYGSREIYNRFAKFSLAGDKAELARIARLFEECPYEAVAGNGYAFVLPHLASTLPKDLRLIHLQRRDRQGCIQSLVKMSQFFPQACANYSPRADVDFLVERTAAFHLGEMDKEAWEALPLPDKYAWYYDKTHALLTEAARRYPSLHVYTEDLNDQETLRRIAGFVGVAAKGPFKAPRKNSFTYCDVSQIEPSLVDKAQWLYSNFDFNEGARDDLFAIDHFCERFLSWKNYQLMEGDKGELAKYMQTEEEMLRDIDRAVARLEARIGEMRRLRARLRPSAGQEALRQLPGYQPVRARLKRLLTG